MSRMCGEKDGIERAGEQVVKGVIVGESKGRKGCGRACLV